MERSQNPRKISRHNRSSTHDDESIGRRRSRTFSQDDSANVPNDPDSKNVYYENQLTKKDYDIQELRYESAFHGQSLHNPSKMIRKIVILKNFRKQLMDVEIRLRENESVAMSRQLESVAHNEEMTEKVRVLEGDVSVFLVLLFLFQASYKCCHRQVKSTTSAISSPSSSTRWDLRIPPAKRY